jgi:hypothetical protein
MLPESLVFRARHGAMPHSDARLLCYKADSLTWQQMSLGMEKLTFASVNKVRGARGTWGSIALTVRTGGCCRDECRARRPLSAAET